MGKLLRLELFNFKSYKGHHVLLFGDSYFTSIIGPNGSGKSNSMDAISFVLGIKSSHLRSAHLRDLVYRGRVLKHSKINADGDAVEDTNGHSNGHAEGGEEEEDDDDDAGTQTRSHRSDPNTAWVMAVYVDDGGDEQKWKRSITSNGQSEYRINNRVVSAKEYNEALELENILIKARNFLVFQGDVEAIASQSPRDLTRLVEQISGSLEYKEEYERLKAESEKANEDQAFKLNQRRAMNSEIKQYQEQKREAENYERKALERDEAIVKHVLWKLYHFQRVMEESGAEIQKHQEDLKEFRRAQQKSEEKLEAARREHAKVTREVAKAETEIKQQEKAIEETENSLVPVQEKLSISTHRLQTFQSRIAEVTKERDQQAKSVEQFKRDLATVQKAQARWEKEFQEAAQQGRALSADDFAEYQKLRSEVSKRTAADQIKVDNLARQLRTVEETNNSLRSRVDSSRALVQKTTADIEELTERLKEVKQQRKETEQSIKSKRDELNTYSSKRARANNRRSELEEKLQTVMMKLIDADSGRRETDREARARETVSAMRRIFPGVKGRFHELCKPKQKKFETAVGIVLGRHWNSVIVDSEKTAKDCIQYLKDQRVGQTTFIPLDTIQVKAVNPNLRGMHRGMRLAIDTIEYENSLERAIMYACGNDIICDTLTIAKQLCFEQGVDCTAVTIDGTKIHKGGLMTGGRGANDKPRRFEDKEVENLRQLRDGLLADLQQLGSLNTHRQAWEEETLQSELSGLELKLTGLRSETESLERNISSKRVELDHAQRALRDAEPKFQQQTASVTSLTANLKQYQDSVSTAEDTIFAAFCERLGYTDIRAYEAQQGSRQQEEQAKKLEFATQIAKLENQLKFETDRLQETQDRITRIEASAKRDQELVKTLQEEREGIDAELEELAQQLEQLRESLNELQETAKQKNEKVKEQRAELQKRNANLLEKDKAVAELEATVQRAGAGRYALLRRCRIEEIKIPLAEDSEPLSVLPLNELQKDPDAMDVDNEDEDEGVEDYGIEVEYDGLDEDLKEDDSAKMEEKLKEEIDNITAELEKMAPNMRATDRLEGVEARLKHTEREFDQARRAAKRAKDDFEDVKDKRFELFNKAFNHISDQIGAVYKDLTRSVQTPLGGQAYLDAEDSDEPYLYGLKYHAMPPLKRFRDMEHLSGGEKTMAALALLFAVHSYQPSPFFVLDEVDAALDNANVTKLVAYIKRHAGPGMQFIVISLKPGFFEGSETLVGVMRDQSVNSSNTLTLDLRKYN